MEIPCGIIAIDSSIASKVMSAEEVSMLSSFSEEYITKELGFQNKRIARTDETPSDFAIQATSKLLKKTSIKPQQLDFIIYCSNGLYDHHFWSPSAFIQHKIHAGNAMTFEINNGCNAANMGLFVGKNLLTTQEEWKYGLVIISDTLSKFIDYSDASSFPLLSFSDGAVAVLIAKNAQRNLLLGSAFHTDGDFANCAKIYINNPNYLTPVNNEHIKMEQSEKTKILRDSLIADNYVRVIRKAIDKAGINRKEVSYILTNQNSTSIVSKVLKKLEFDDAHYYQTSKHYGHVAAADTLLGLQDLLDMNLVHENEFVITASVGVGFHWGAQVIKI